MCGVFWKIMTVCCNGTELVGVNTWAMKGQWDLIPIFLSKHLSVIILVMHIKATRIIIHIRVTTVITDMWSLENNGCLLQWH